MGSIAVRIVNSFFLFELSFAASAFRFASSVLRALFGQESVG